MGPVRSSVFLDPELGMYVAVGLVYSSGSARCVVVFWADCSDVEYFWGGLW